MSACLLAGPNVRAPAHLLMANAVTLPYVAHAFAARPISTRSSRPLSSSGRELLSPIAEEPAAGRTEASTTAVDGRHGGGAAARSGIMFHGGLGRFDFGNRERMSRVMKRVQALFPRIRVDMRVSEFSRGNQTLLREVFNLSAYNASGGV